jgi:hypothetical protein
LFSAFASALKHSSISGASMPMYRTRTPPSISIESPSTTRTTREIAEEVASREISTVFDGVNLLENNTTIIIGLKCQNRVDKKRYLAPCIAP